METSEETWGLACNGTTIGKKWELVREYKELAYIGDTWSKR